MFWLFILQFVFSYIPHSHFILQKTGESHGKGDYQVQQEVIFQNSKERIVIQETWTIDDGIKMHLSAKGPNINISNKYDFQYKYFLNEKNNLVKQRLGEEFFESFFYLQEAKDLARKIYQSKILGQEILSPQKRFYHLSQIEYKGQNFIRISRSSGHISYAFGEPSKDNEPPHPPGLWIQQNDFHILKLRFPSQTTVNANDYDIYSNKLSLPKERIVEWGKNKTPIQLIRVSSIRLKGQEAKLCNTSSSHGLSFNQYGETSLAKAIEEFYTRFR